MPRWPNRPPAREWPDKIDKAKIDAEPTPERHRYAPGTRCWFIVDRTWFLCEAVAPSPDAKPGTIAIKPVTGKDADRQVDWPYGTVLEFRRGNKSGGCRSLRLYESLRPLKARRP